MLVAYVRGVRKVRNPSSRRRPGRPPTLRDFGDRSGFGIHHENRRDRRLIPRRINVRTKDDTSAIRGPANGIVAPLRRWLTHDYLPRLQVEDAEKPGAIRSRASDTGQLRPVRRD